MKQIKHKKGDTVRVVAGVSKGQEGVFEKLSFNSRVIIEGDDIRKDMLSTPSHNATNPRWWNVKARCTNPHFKCDVGDPQRES